MLKSVLTFAALSLTLGQFARISDTKLYIFDILFSFYCMYGLFFLRKNIKTSKYLGLFFIFSLFSLMSIYYSKDNFSLISLGYFLRWNLYLLTAMVTFNCITQKIYTVEFLKELIIKMGVIVSFFGYLQLLFLPDFGLLDPSLGWDPHKNRLAASFFDPNFVGAFLTLVLATMLFTDGLLKTNRAKFIFILVALFLTYSRSAWVMFGIVVFFYGLKKSVGLIFLAILLAFSAYFAVPRIQTRLNGITDPADSASYRLVSWQNTLTIIEDHLLFGVGFNAMKDAKIKYGFLTPDTLEEHSASGSDSSFLLIFATTGILGLVIFTMAFLFPIVDNPSFFKYAVFFGLLVESQFINSLFYPQILFLWLILFILFDVEAGKTNRLHN